MAALLSCGQSVPVPADHPNLEEHQKVIVGMRPEHFALNTSGAPLSGRTTLVEPTGAQTHVTFEMAATLATAVLESGIDVDLGQTLTVSIDPEKVYIFDKETGLRV